jgi:hypothetical protein
VGARPARLAVGEETAAPVLPTAEELELLLFEEADHNEDVHYVCNHCWYVNGVCTSFCGVEIRWGKDLPDWLEANCVECNEIFEQHVGGILRWSCPVCGNS